MTRGAFWKRFTGRWEERGRGMLRDRRRERWRDSKTEKEQNTRDLLRKRERETEKRIRPIGAWHDRVSDDGCLCISRCLHQRHRNTTHTHSASSYKHRCSPIKAAVSTKAISGLPPLFHGWGKPSSVGWSLARCLENGPKKTYYASSHWRKKTWLWFNKQFTQET